MQVSSVKRAENCVRLRDVGCCLDHSMHVAVIHPTATTIDHHAFYTSPSHPLIWASPLAHLDFESIRATSSLQNSEAIGAIAKA